MHTHSRRVTGGIFALRIDYASKVFNLSSFSFCLPAG